jgi:hypothetical protein
MLLKKLIGVNNTVMGSNPSAITYPPIKSRLQFRAFSNKTLSPYSHSKKITLAGL